MYLTKDQTCKCKKFVSIWAHQVWERCVEFSGICVIVTRKDAAAIAGPDRPEKCLYFRTKIFNNKLNHPIFMTRNWLFIYLILLWTNVFFFFFFFFCLFLCWNSVEALSSLPLFTLGGRPAPSVSRSACTKRFFVFFFSMKFNLFRAKCWRQLTRFDVFCANFPGWIAFRTCAWDLP